MDTPPAPPVAPGTTAPTPQPAVANPSITIDDFAKIQLRTATVLACTPHPNADKLLVLQVDLGDEKRQICAGIKGHVEPESLVGKQIIVVANLAPRMMRGQISQGMLLAASDTDGRVVPATIMAPVAPGSIVR